MLDCPPHIATEFGEYCLTGLSTIYSYNDIENLTIPSDEAKTCNDTNANIEAHPSNDTNANIEAHPSNDTNANIEAYPCNPTVNRGIQQTQNDAVDVQNRDGDAEPSSTTDGNTSEPASASPIGLPEVNHDILVVKKQIDENSPDFINYFNVRQSSDLLFFHQCMRNFVITPTMFANSLSVNFQSLKLVKTIECTNKSLQKLLHFTLSDMPTLTKVILHDYVSSNLLFQDNLHENDQSSLQNSPDLRQHLREKERRLLAYLQIFEPTLKDPPSFMLTQLCNLVELRIGMGCGSNFETFTLSSAFCASNLP